MELEEPDLGELLNIVVLNGFGSCIDAAAQRLRGDPPSLGPGLYPEASFFNHSCCPNAEAILLGGALVSEVLR
jgi:hypothetical protein